MGRKYEGVRKKSASSIEISFYYQGQRCFEIVKLKPIATNLKRAYTHRMAVIDAINTGTFNYAETFPESPNRLKFVPQCGYNVEQWLTLCLGRWKAHLKASTYNGYRKIVNNVLIPEFGGLLLSEPTRRNVSDYVRNNAGSSASRISNVLGPLRVAFEEAAADELIEVNPIENYKLPRKSRRQVKTDTIDPFDQAERQAIYNAMPADEREYAEGAWWAGLRPSELVALLWDDIDWVKDRVRVNKAITQDSDEAEAPKTEAGERFVKLLPATRAALERQKQYIRFHSSGHVFVNPRTGEPWTGDRAYRRTTWTHALKLSGVRYRCPYQCRHTFASMLIMAGENIMWVSKQLGHTDWAFTARTYSRWIDTDAPESGLLAAEKWRSAQ